jgi:hypothetical protein
MFKKLLLALVPVTMLAAAPASADTPKGRPVAVAKVHKAKAHKRVAHHKIAKRHRHRPHRAHHRKGH